MHPLYLDSVYILIDDLNYDKPGSINVAYKDGCTEDTNYVPWTREGLAAWNDKILDGDCLQLNFSNDPSWGQSEQHGGVSKLNEIELLDKCNYCLGWQC